MSFVAIVPIAIGVLLLLVALLIECLRGCGCCCFGTKSKQNEKRKQLAIYAKFLRITFVIVALGLIGASLFVGDRLNKSVTSITGHVDTIHTPFDEPLKHTAEIHDILQKFSCFFSCWFCFTLCLLI